MRPAPPITALALALVLGPQALATSLASYSMEVLVDGYPIQEYRARGTTYVEARRGREYSIRLRNHTGERVAVALAVDGLNSIDAKTTTPQAARKWILDPWQTITLDGWQTSDSTARRFVFTTEERSYGEWLGKTQNLGIISAAFFREVRPVPMPRPYAIPEEEQSWWDDLWGSERRDAEPSAESDSRASGAAPPAPMEAPATPSAKRREHKGLGRQQPKDEGLAATGIGREVGHEVVQVPFQAEAHPATVISIRYEYHDALVRLGVLPTYPSRDSLARRERARGFEGGTYAPDPYR